LQGVLLTNGVNSGIFGVQMMRRIHLIGLTAMALALWLAAPARCQFVADGLSAFEQTAAADVIVIGKVTALEPEPVFIERSNATKKLLHLVATIRVEERLLGGKGLTHVRVAFVPEIPTPLPNPAKMRFL
jgi:hypothetical protein